MEEMKLTQWLPDSAAVLRERLEGRTPKIGIILGSGWGPVAERIQVAVAFPFAEVPHMQPSTATSHVGRFVCGVLGGKEILCMQGRLHGYEGNSSQQVVYPVWLMDALGIETLIVTNAVGAINEGYGVGDICVICDHINFTGRNPIQGLEPDRLSDRFFSMHEPYDPLLRQLAQDVAAGLGLPSHESIYLGLAGPSFETAAEIRAFRSWGADTVAMSLCEEVIAARHVGLRVLGLSLAVNMACGVGGTNPLEDDPLQVARSREADLCHLIQDILERMEVPSPILSL